MTTENKPPEVRILVDYSPRDKHGRWGKIFHIFDTEGGEVKLNQKEALKMAKAILKIAKEK